MNNISRLIKLLSTLIDIGEIRTVECSSIKINDKSFIYNDSEDNTIFHMQIW